ncbi:DUF4198 domain-containing protein [Chitinophaga nivalis]|uniref:DUF4198 domain-containing protein n=1 Tax=Chitinophaga nivalis TaxID=2991709 RepID=A0ABT3IHX4_9BACT|nr:DUF4198 domain-containing protein [Chitinophaga nivalis]MCW3466778.1 DUF4198 domain-containing protein [Chitinophaga nivalis]MCW3483531.1 DUF4198 domain-containing protein [Chitinophaga nivalis]
MKIKLLLSLLLVCCCSHVFAHMLWIETQLTGTKGKEQQVKIYYGEYTEHTPEKVSDWYSDVKTFTLWLIGPDKQKTKLTCTPGADHFTASFTPATDGVYTLAVSHDARELGGTTKYQFNASATVAVGKTAVATETVTGHELTAFTGAGKVFKVNKPVAVKTSFKSTPTEKIQVAVFSPSGWNTTIVTDAAGVATFVPLWPGKYMLEATNMHTEDGTLYENKYNGVWRNATIAFEVVK